MADRELFGGKVEFSTDGVSYTRVPAVKGVKVPELALETKKRNSLDNTSRINTYRAGWADPGEFSISCWADDGDLEQAYTLQARSVAQGVKTSFRITLESGSTWDFECFPMVTPPDAGDVESDLEFSIKGKVSGEIEFVAA
jgi:hypothetical protein